MTGPQGRHGTADVMTVAEVATRLGVARSTVYRLIKTGDLPIIPLGTGSGRVKYISRPGLERLLENAAKRASTARWAGEDE
jgi:excisionase family DNA binding protein